MTMNHAIGVCLMMAGACFLIRHILLRPDPRTWPPIGTWSRAVLFCVGVVFCFIGVKMYASTELHTYGFLVIAVTTLIYKANNLVGDLCQRGLIRKRVCALRDLQKDGWFIQSEPPHPKTP